MFLKKFNEALDYCNKEFPDERLIDSIKKLIHHFKRCRANVNFVNKSLIQAKSFYEKGLVASAKQVLEAILNPSENPLLREIAEHNKDVNSLYAMCNVYTAEQNSDVLYQLNHLKTAREYMSKAEIIDSNNKHNIRMVKLINSNLELLQSMKINTSLNFKLFLKKILFKFLSETNQHRATRFYQEIFRNNSNQRMYYIKKSIKILKS